LAENGGNDRPAASRNRRSGQGEVANYRTRASATIEWSERTQASLPLLRKARARPKVPSTMPPKPLFRAFATLYRAAPPEQRDRALRHAIAALVDDRKTRTVAPPPIPPRASPSPPTSRWEPLRVRLRELAGNTPAGREAVARSIGLSPTTLTKLLAPGSSGPGAAILDRAQAWLASYSQAPEGSLVTLGDPQSASRDTPDAKPNDRDPAHRRAGPLHPNKLTTQQSEALGLLLSLDQRAIRKAGVAPELAERAAAGQAVPVEVVERLVAFLARE